MGNMVAFLFTWISVLVVGTSSQAIMTLTLAQYVVTFFPGCGNPEQAKKLVAAFACGGSGALVVALMATRRRKSVLPVRVYQDTVFAAESR